jgi:hypothetical protein
MSILIRQEPTPAKENEPQAEPKDDTQIAERDNRIAILKQVAGIWAGREDIPDSVEYQRQLRAEWR